MKETLRAAVLLIAAAAALPIVGKAAATDTKDEIGVVTERRYSLDGRACIWTSESLWRGETRQQNAMFVDLGAASDERCARLPANAPRVALDGYIPFRKALEVLETLYYCARASGSCANVAAAHSDALKAKLIGRQLVELDTMPGGELPWVLVLCNAGSPIGWGDCERLPFNFNEGGEIDALGESPWNDVIIKE